jgi:hypothetical protein
LIKAAVILVVLAGAAAAWDCPRCGTPGQGAAFCSVCGLPEPPAGMAFVPGCTVTVSGEQVEVAPFFIDSMPVTYRDVLPWMETAVTSEEDLAAVVTGQFDESYQFLSFTPFINNEDGTALTVPAASFGMPAASFTWEGATLFLTDAGKRLPTLAQITAANEAGLITRFDVYTVMSSFEPVMTATMGQLLGPLGRQSMFMGYSTASERVMWEWTRDEWALRPWEPGDPLGPYRTIWKCLDTPVTGAAGRDTGYFNVIFRGVVSLPEDWQ